MTNITERMKKYAELIKNKVFLNYCDDMFTDLQSTMNALEVAREALSTCRLFAGCEREYDEQAVEEALQQINQILGEKK